MSMTDPIGDLLTAIRNANEIGKKSLVLPASVLKVHVAQVLKEEGYLANVSVEPAVPQSKLKVDLKYGPDGERVIRTIERVSTPAVACTAARRSWCRSSRALASTCSRRRRVSCPIALPVRRTSAAKSSPRSTDPQLY